MATLMLALGPYRFSADTLAVQQMAYDRQYVGRRSDYLASDFEMKPLIPNLFWDWIAAVCLLILLLIFIAMLGAFFISAVVVIPFLGMVWAFRKALR